MRRLSGNHAGWLTTIAKEVREAGQPVSLDFLSRVVPGQFATAVNDGHVTAAENGINRNDFKAGQRIWIEEAVAALRKAGLVDGPDDALVWTAEQDGIWRVKFRTTTPTIYGRAESLAARDRHMLGETTEPEIAREPDVQPGYLLKGWAEPLKIEIERGIDRVIDKGMRALDIHPIAMALPPMTVEEQKQLRADIERRGVIQPLLLYPDPNDLSVKNKPKVKVLDGRHRGYFASVLGKPVRVELFKGSEEEARREVASLNLMRRHMTKEQRITAAWNLFGSDAKEETKQAKREGVGRPRKEHEKSPTKPSAISSGKEAYEIVWERMGGEASGTTKNAVRQLEEVVDAPETRARIEAGETQFFSKWKADARKEKGLPAQPRNNGRTYPTTVYQQLGRAISDLRTIVNEPDLPAGAMPSEIRIRLDELGQILQRLNETALSTR